MAVFLKSAFFSITSMRFHRGRPKPFCPVWILCTARIYDERRAERRIWVRKKRCRMKTALFEFEVISALWSARPRSRRATRRKNWCRLFAMIWKIHIANLPWGDKYRFSVRGNISTLLILLDFSTTVRGNMSKGSVHIYTIIFINLPQWPRPQDYAVSTNLSLAIVSTWLHFNPI